MTIKSQKLLPSAEIRASKQTISTSLLRDLKPEKPIKIDNVSKESSLAEKFGVIFKFLNKEYKRDRMSWFRERKRKQEERRKKREEELEKNKGKSKIGKGISATLPLKNIFDNISNFLLFLAGGFLLNKILDILPQLMEIGKILKPITIGIYNFGKFMLGSVIGFIDAGYAIHDDLRSKVEELGGEDAVEKFDKFAKQFKKVINGAIILAMLSTLLPKKRRGGGRKADCKPCQPCICREPQRVPVRVFAPNVVTSGITATATDVGYNFNWGEIFNRLKDPIKNLLGVGRQREGRIINPNALPTPESVREPAYATLTLKEALSAWSPLQQQISDLLRQRSRIANDTGIINPQRVYAYTQRELETKLIEASQLKQRILELDPTWTPSSTAQLTPSEGVDLTNIINAMEGLADLQDAVTWGSLLLLLQFLVPDFQLQVNAAELNKIKALNAAELNGGNENLSNKIKALNVATSYDTPTNLMVFNKTFIQDRYIIG